MALYYTKLTITLLLLPAPTYASSLRNYDNPTFNTDTDFQVTHEHLNNLEPIIVDASSMTGGKTGITGVEGEEESWDSSSATGSGTGAPSSVQLQNDSEQQIDTLDDATSRDALSKEEPTISLQAGEDDSFVVGEVTSDYVTPKDFMSKDSSGLLNVADTTEALSPHDPPPLNLNLNLNQPTISSNNDDEQQPLTDEPADAVPAVRNAVDRYRRVKKQLSQYSAAQKVLEEQTADAAKLAAQTRVLAEKQLQESAHRHHDHEHGLDFQPLPLMKTKWQPWGLEEQ